MDRNQPKIFSPRKASTNLKEEDQYRLPPVATSYVSVAASKIERLMKEQEKVSITSLMF